MATYPALPTAAFPLPRYVVLVWEVPLGLLSQTVDAAVRRAFEDRAYAEIAPRVHAIRVASVFEREQLAAVVDYIATKEYPGQLNYSISPALPPGVWQGRRQGGWDTINAVTFTDAATP